MQSDGIRETVNPRKQRESRTWQLRAMQKVVGSSPFNRTTPRPTDTALTTDGETVTLGDTPAATAKGLRPQVLRF
jgi:hypothetical protein